MQTTQLLADKRPLGRRRGALRRRRSPCMQRRSGAGDGGEGRRKQRRRRKGRSVCRSWEGGRRREVRESSVERQGSNALPNATRGRRALTRPHRETEWIEATRAE
uniref:Uncharacterized protein n=1 Tax=Toxoplasma gondii COUG TaxID=1074873 RepID=A0A2G8XNP0_TOXGO|nr:hypothetical protein TGCOUG_395590 [Toxoplasma gondii COUG]